MTRSLTVISLLLQSTTHCRYRVYTKFLLTYTAIYRGNRKVLPLGITALQPQSHFHLGTPYIWCDIMHVADNSHGNHLPRYVTIICISSVLRLIALNKKKKKVEFCFKMTMLCRTSVKMYVLLCACDFLIGEWEEANQLRGPHKIQTSHQPTIPEGRGRVIKYLSYA